MRDKSLNIKTLYILSFKKPELQNNILKMSKEAFTGSHILAVRMLISKHA